MNLLKVSAVAAAAVIAALFYSGSSFTQPTADKAEAGPTQIIAFNTGFCPVAGIAFAGIDAVSATLACSGFDHQNNLQTFVKCLRGTDIDNNGTKDCLTLEDVLEFDPDGTIDITYEEMKPIDLDGNQFHAGQAMYFIAFVNDDENMRFTTTVGTFVDPQDDSSTGKDWHCNTGDQDPDCDNDPDTVGDGVVVAKLRIPAGDDPDIRGEHTVIAIQEAVGFPVTFTIAGAPDEIELAPLFGKTSIQVGGTAPTKFPNIQQPTDCTFAATVDGVLGANSSPYKMVVVAKAFDDEGTELSAVGLNWDTPYNEVDPQLAYFPQPQSDLGGGALPLTPTLDTGALGLSFPQFVCSKGEETGTLHIEVAFELNSVFGSEGDEDERAKIDIPVVGRPTSLTLSAAPLLLPCDGVNTSTVSALLKRDDGENAANGNEIHWLAQVLATANPLTSNTADGVATTVLTPLSGEARGVPVRATLGEPTRYHRNDDDTLDLDDRESNPDYLEASIIVQCQEGGAPSQAGPGQPVTGGGAAGGGTSPTGTISGPDTGSGGYAGAGPPGLMPLLLLLAGAAALAGTSYALGRRS